MSARSNRIAWLVTIALLAVAVTASGQQAPADDTEQNEGTPRRASLLRPALEGAAESVKLETLAIPDPPEGTWGAMASGTGYAYVGTGSIAGTITDADTTDPIEGVTVSIYDAAGSYITSGITDGTGSYTSAAGLASGTYHARTSSGGNYVNELFDNVPCMGNCVVTAGTPIAVGDGEAVTGIDFALDKGGSISGTVTDVATGSGITAEVGIFDAGDNWVSSGYTDGNGYYITNAGLLAGTYYALTFNLSGYFDELYDDIRCSPGTCGFPSLSGTPIVVGAQEDVTGIDFALVKGATISGTISDSITGLAIPDIQVTIYDEFGAYASYGYTSGAGQYTTRAPLLEGTYFAVTNSYSSLTKYFDELYDDIPCADVCDPTTGTPIAVSDGEAVVGIDFALDQASSISGRVTDSVTSAALFWVEVGVYDSGGNWVDSAWTDSSGDFSVGPIQAGTYFVLTQAWNSYGDAYVDEVYDGIPCTFFCDPTTGTAVVVGASETVTGVDFALDPTGSISGTVTDVATTAAIEGVSVVLYDASGDYLTSTSTDGTGGYSCGGLPPGTYYLQTSGDSGYYNELYNDIPCHAACVITTGTPVEVGIGDVVTGVDFALIALAGGGSISGTVVDATTALPIEGELVRIYDGFGNYITNELTDAAGEYTSDFGFPAGTYHVDVYSNSGYLNELYDDIPCASGCDVTTGTPIAVGAGEAVTGVDFGLDIGGGITGTVTDATTGTAIQGHLVRVFDTDGDFVTQGSTDSNGVYRSSTGLPSGTYFARTIHWSGTYLDEIYDDLPCVGECDPTTGMPIAVGEAEMVQGIDFSLSPLHHLFSDDFESGDCTAWSHAVGEN